MSNSEKVFQKIVCESIMKRIADLGGSLLPSRVAEIELEYYNTLHVLRDREVDSYLLDMLSDFEPESDGSWIVPESYMAALGMVYGDSV